MLVSCTQRLCCLKPVSCKSASRPHHYGPLTAPVAIFNSCSAYITIVLYLNLLIMSPAWIVDDLACRTASRHTICFDSRTMAGNGLYYRPVVCKFCEKIFDFPTLTTDINERYAIVSSPVVVRLTQVRRDVPVRTRICSRCLWEVRYYYAMQHEIYADCTRWVTMKTSEKDGPTQKQLFDAHTQPSQKKHCPS